MTRAKKRILIVGSTLAGSLLAVLVLLPLVLGDELQALFLREANERLEADVAVGGIGLGLLRTFPDLSLRVDDLVLTNRAPFEGRELFRAGRVLIRIDLLSLLPGRSPRVKRVHVQDAHADLVISEDGTLNYLVLEPAPEAAATPAGGEDREPYRVDLQEYSVERLNLVFENRRTGFSLSAVGVQHGGDGRVTGTVVELGTRTQIDSLLAAMGEMALLRGVAAEGAADISFDSEDRTVRFSSDRIALNDMLMEAAGTMRTLGDTLELDLGFRAPSQSFKSLLSVVPAFARDDFGRLEADGTVQVDGTVEGRSVAGSQDLPGFQLSAVVSDGRIHYPDAPSDLTDIGFRLTAAHPDGSPLDAATLDVTDARATLDQGGLQGALSVSSPVTDPAVRLEASADLDLGKLAAALALEGTSLAGHLDGEMRLAGRRSDFEARRIEDTTASGAFSLRDVVVTRTDWDQDVRVRSMTGAISPVRLTFSDFDLQVGASDLSGRGHLQDVVPHLMGDADLGGEFALRSRFMDLTELQAWIKKASGDAATVEEATPVVIPRDLALRLEVGVDTLRYGRHEVTGLAGIARIADGALTFEEVTGGVLGGRLALEGSYATSADAPPLVDVGLQLSGVSFGRAFQEVGFMNALAPILAQATGTFSTGISLSSELSPELGPLLGTLDAAGTLRTAEVTLQSQFTERLASLLGNQALSMTGARDLIMRFGIEDGRLTISPTAVRLGSFDATLTGSTGLDRSIDYRIGTTLPTSGIRIPEALAAAGIQSGNIPVEIRVGGTIDSPALEPVFGDVMGQAQAAVVGQASAQALERVRTAEVRGDSLVAQARREAEQVQAQARDAVDRLRAEAQTRADAVVAEARGNPLAEAGARALADRILSEANRQADALIADADARANALVQAAEEERDALIAEARAGAGG
jgi:vacuolar-type H+-ATPase subunit H